MNSISRLTSNKRSRIVAIAAACGLASVALLRHYPNVTAADAPPLVNPTGATAASTAAGEMNSPFDKKAATPSTGDWNMWGGTPFRNMVSGEKNPPTDWDVGDPDDPKDDKGIKWEAVVGSKAYGNPIVSDGKVYIGTNNESKKDPKYVNANGDAIDGGVLMCFDEKTGKFLWQRYYAKLAAGRVNDWPGEGLCSTVYSEGKRIWYCTNRCEVVCLDVSASSPVEMWKVDMMGQLGVFPHNMTAAAITCWGDLIYVTTGNGVDDTHKNVVAPQAPGIVCFNKNTGKVVWTHNDAGENVLHGQWASVSIAEVNGRPIVIAPQGDAWVYAYDARDGKLVWKFDSNPKDSIYPQTRNEIIATPVVVGNKMYIANGQDPEHGTGKAHLWCVRIDMEGDVSAEISEAPKPKIGELVTAAEDAANRKGKPNPNSGVVWHFFNHDDDGDGKIKGGEQMHRSISTCAVSNGLCFIGDFDGFIHCFDAETGKQYWWDDLEADCWGSPLVCDGKVYIGDGDGDIAIYEVSKTKKLIATHNMGAAVYGSPVMANGTMYILSLHKLFAINGTGAAGGETK